MNSKREEVAARPEEGMRFKLLPVPCVTLSALTPDLSRRFIIAVQVLLPGRGGITLTVYDTPSPCAGYMQYRDLNIYAGIIL